MISRRSCLWVIATLIAGAAVQPASAQSAIRVDASVALHGESLAGLRQEDFILREDRTRRSISALSQEDLPLDIVLICPRQAIGDGGPFQQDEKLYQAGLGQLAQFAAATILKTSRPEDRVALISYGIEPRLELPLSQDRNATAEAIRRVGQSIKETDKDEYTANPFTVEAPARSTALSIKSLSIDYAMHVLSETDASAQANRRRLIVMVTEFATQERDGDTYAGVPDEPVIRRLWEAGIVLTAVGGGDREPLRDPTRRQPIDATYRRNNPMHIAQATGGDAIVPKDAQDAKELAGVLARARQRYILTFDQPTGLPPGQERTITIDLSPDARKRFPDAVVRARQGYVTH